MNDKDGRYYPKFIRLVTPVLFEKDGRKKYYDIELFNVDFVERVSGKIRKLRKGETGFTGSAPEVYRYDPQFWSQYLEEYSSYLKLDDDVARSLERIRPLEQQFRSSSDGQY